MTTRLNGFVVTFDKPIREDDAEELRSAILMLKRVIDVRPLESDGPADSSAKIQVLAELERAIYDVFRKHRGF